MTLSICGCYSDSEAPYIHASHRCQDITSRRTPICRMFELSLGFHSTDQRILHGQKCNYYFRSLHWTSLSKTGCARIPKIGVSGLSCQSVLSTAVRDAFPRRCITFLGKPRISLCNVGKMWRFQPICGLANAKSGAVRHHAMLGVASLVARSITYGTIHIRLLIVSGFLFIEYADDLLCSRWTPRCRIDCRKEPPPEPLSSATARCPMHCKDGTKHQAMQKQCAESTKEFS